jgi:thiamine-phosphate pyrophosphorylase
MCLTQDGIGAAHARQVEDLCSAGARWIQLRMKGASLAAWLSEAKAAVSVCRGRGVILIVNDSVEIARESGADGVHLGSLDTDWRGARSALGPSAIIGGTVNNSGEALRAVESGCLDYAGVGPLRFTSTKRGLSPVIGIGGIRRLVAELRGLPAWAIGGIEPADLPQIRAAGAAGAAVSAFLFRGGRVEENLRALLGAWAQAPEPVLSP